MPNFNRMRLVFNANPVSALSGSVKVREESHFDPTPAGKVTIVTKGGQRSRLSWIACPPPPWAFFPQLHKVILCYIIDRAVWERTRQMLKRPQLPVHTHSSVLFSFWRVPYSVGDCRQSFPFTRPAISTYRHGCKTLDGEAFRPNHGLA